MKNKGIKIITVLLLVSLLFSACNTSQAANTDVETGIPPELTTSIQATVDAGIAATSTAQMQIMGVTTETILATMTAIPTQAVPPPDEISEEELAQLFDKTVNEAIYYASQLETATNESTADNFLTEDEFELLMKYYGLSQSEMEYALSLAEMYLEIYCDLGEETVDLLYKVAEDLENLSSMSDEAMELIFLLENILANGGTIASEDVSTFLQYSHQYVDLQTILEKHAGEWITALQGDLAVRANEYLQIQPSKVAGNRLEALIMASDYVTSVQNALGDGFLSNSELNNIAQLGANVEASFEYLNLPNMNNISGSINNITSNLARGQLPTAAANLGQLEGLVGRQ